MADDGYRGTSLLRMGLGVYVLLHRNIKAYSSHFTISEIRLFLPKIATHIDGYLCRHIPPNPVFSSSIYII